MGKFNPTRWLAASAAAGVLMWLLEGLASNLYVADLEVAMKAHNLSMEMTPALIAFSLIPSFVAGATMMFFYAMCLPRLGAGMKPALIVASAYWAGGYLLSLVGYQMMGLFPPAMLNLWGVIGLVEMNLSAALGARIYRDA